MTDDLQRWQQNNLSETADNDDDERALVDVEQETAFTGAALNDQATSPRASRRQRRVEFRLLSLNQAIEDNPAVLSNYVLRGELYLMLDEPELAAADCRTALSLAAQQVEKRDWGVVVQAMYDRAMLGLERALRGLAQREGQN